VQKQNPFKADCILKMKYLRTITKKKLFLVSKNNRSADYAHDAAEKNAIKNYQNTCQVNYEQNVLAEHLAVTAEFRGTQFETSSQVTTSLI
jgi:hypothetical protein